MKRFWALVVFGLFFPLFCFAQSQTGYASYNASKTGLFISHPSLSFNSKVLVTNLTNNRSVEATVNGRIPITADRIAELTRDTGDAIGMARTGMTRIRIEELALPAAAAPAVVPVPAAVPAPALPPPAAATPAPAPQVAAAPQTAVTPPPSAPPAAVVPAPAAAAPPPAVPQTAVVPLPVVVVPPPVSQTQAAVAPPPVSQTSAAVAPPPAVVPPPPVPQTQTASPAAPPAPATQEPSPAVQIIQEEEYISLSGCPVTNCANTPLLVIILILLILIIALLVTIIVLILRRFPFLPKHYRVWLRRHVFFAKRRQK